jgi:hypothetical protein
VEAAIGKATEGDEAALRAEFNAMLPTA